MQAYITCLIKNKILQPTICFLSWVHAIYITIYVTDVSFKSTGYLFLQSLVIVRDCLPLEKVNHWETTVPACYLCAWMTPVQVSKQVMVPRKCRVWTQDARGQWLAKWSQRNDHVQLMIYRSVSFFFKDFFLIWTICKVFIEFSRILLLFYLLVCHEACGILAPQPSIEPVPHASEDDVLVAYQRSPYRSLLIILSFFFFFSGSLLFRSYPGCSQLLINAYTFEVLHLRKRDLSKK